MTQSDLSNTKQVVGYSVTSTWCLACAPEGVTEGGCDVTTDPTSEKYNWGYGWCDECGKELRPHEHDWGQWEVYGPLNLGDPRFDKDRRLLRHCKVEGCSAYEEHEYDESMVVVA